jgi:16S rRNA (cytidine1402-2'-O)-methyltransferase
MSAEPSESSAQEQSRSSGLIIVPTPIGNLADISLRALEVLASVDAILCEDTRVSAKLLLRHGIHRRLIAYHEHNAERMRPKVLQRLRRGESLALVSDAGTPLVSDPGFKLVRAALAENIRVTALPGPCAALTALVISGLPTNRFFFAGFLSAKAAQRRSELSELSAIPAPLIFFEAAQRLPAALDDMAEILGPRPAAVARELTKLFEEVRRAELGELAAHYAAAGPPRGEVVVVVGPPARLARSADADLDAAIGEALSKLRLRDAVDAVAATTGMPRRKIYARALQLAGKPPEDGQR